MRRRLKIFVAFIGLIVVAIVCLVLWSQAVEKHNRNTLANEVNRIDAPANCTEESRSYQPYTIDVVSEWEVVYSCSTTGKEFYNGMNEKLTRLGYPSFAEISNLSTSNNTFILRYSLESGEYPEYPADWSGLEPTEKAEFLRKMSEEKPVTKARLAISLK